MEVWLIKSLTEKMVALPFECGLQTIQYVMTLGATSFLNFISANMVELGVMVFMRVAVRATALAPLPSLLSLSLFSPNFPSLYEGRGTHGTASLPFSLYLSPLL